MQSGGQAAWEMREFLGDRFILVHDLNESTFDLSLMRIKSDFTYELLATAGDPRLGTEDWDDVVEGLLVSKCTDAFGHDPRCDPNLMRDLRQRAVRARQALSDSARTTFEIAQGGNTKSVTVTRGEFGIHAEPLVFRTELILQEMLKGARMECGMIESVVAVGSGSRMPMIIQNLENVTKRPIDMSLLPDMAVSQGAAVFAAYYRDHHRPQVMPAAQNAEVQEALAGISIDSDASPEPPPPPVITPTMPRSLMIGLPGDYVATLLPAGTELPAHCTYQDLMVMASGEPSTVTIPVYEGHLPGREIPYGPLNTQVGALNIQCPSIPASSVLILDVEVDVHRAITFRCWLKDDPSVSGTIAMNPQTISRDGWHILERADMTLNSGGERIRPDERARISQTQQSLIDLCVQYAAKESYAIRSRIIQLGEGLRNEIASIEKKYGI
jgi:hypothetical protein